MQKNRFVILIIASVLVLSAIIAIQAFWLLNSTKVQKERFDQAIMKSLSSVVEKLEKKEAVAQVTSKIQNLPSVSYELSMSADSNKSQDDFDFSNPFFLEEMLVDKSNSSNFPEEFQIELSQPSQDDSSIFIIKKTQKRVLQSSRNSIKGPFKNQEHLNQQKDSEKSVLFNNIVNELAFISINKDNKDRIDFNTLDSIVKAELTSKGIHTDVITDIIDTKSKTLTFNYKSPLKDEIIKSQYKIDLFPNDYLLESDYLVLYFPDRSTFLLHSMWKILALSILIIIILAGLIYFSLSTIFKQKKLGIIKNDFINNMTHELKTPISTISLACEALRDKSMNLPKQRQDSFLKMIHDENKRLYLLVDNVLKSAVWDQPTLQLDKTLFSLQSLVEEVAGSFKIQIEKKSGTLTTEFLQDEDEIIADKVHIANVIYNLLDNANKYSREKPKINIKLQNIADKIELEISDNGIGISNEDKKRIFEKFYRVPTGDVHDIKGFGLGLSYVKSIIEKHEGTIIIQSQIGKGTTCRIRLPIYTI